MTKILIAFLTALLMHGLAFAGTPVNINSADANALANALKGIGPAKAQAIVDYRDEHGAFQDIDELVNVKGIGLRTVDQNREFILIGSATQPAVAPTKPATAARSN